MSNDASQFVGDIPEQYDRGLGPNIFADFAADLARRTAARKPLRVLELAAGTGILSREIRNGLGMDAVLTATDLNAPMLEHARAKFRADENVSFATVDAMALPFGSQSFDLIACQFGVMFFPDRVAAFREAARVLAPGGSYIFNVWGRIDDNDFARITHGVTAEFYPADPPGFYRVPFSYADEAQVTRDLVAGGFGNISHEHVRIEKTIGDVHEFAQGLVFGNPLIAEIRNRGTASADDIAAAVENRLKAELGPEPCQMTIEAIVFSASAV